MSKNLNIETGGELVEVKGTLYKNLIIGPGGDKTILTIGNGDVAQNITLLPDAEFYVESGGVAYGTIAMGSPEVISGGKSYDALLIDGGSQNLKFFGIGAEAYNTIVGDGGSQTVNSGCTVYDTVVQDGGYAFVNGFAERMVVESGGILRIQNDPTAKTSSTSTDLTVEYGAQATVSGANNLKGSTVINGSITFNNNASLTVDGDLYLGIQERATADLETIVDGSLNNFKFVAGSGDLYISLSTTQASGEYYIAEDSNDFNGTVTLMNGDGIAIGNITVGGTLNTAIGSYTLEHKSVESARPGRYLDMLVLTVTTTAGNTTWPTSWYNAPINVTSYAGGGALDFSGATYDTGPSLAVNITGNTDSVTASSSSKAVFVTLTGGTTTEVATASEVENNVFVNGGTVSNIFGSVAYTNEVRIYVSAGTVDSVIAAGKNSHIMKSTITIDSTELIKANIYANMVVGGASPFTYEDMGEKTIDIKQGSFLGLVVGGGRAENGSSMISISTITIKIDSAEFNNNKAYLEAGKDGTTDWIIAGAQAINNSEADIHASNIYITNSEVGKILVGGQAEGANSISAISEAGLYLGTGAVVKGSIYGGGYSENGGTTVTGVSSITVDSSEGAVTLLSGIYGGGANPLGTGISNTVDEFLVTFTGEGSNLSFAGVIDGNGIVANNIVSYSEIEFEDFNGQFMGTINDVNAIRFTGETVMELTSTTDTIGSIIFDYNDRLKQDYDVAFGTGDFTVNSETTLQVIFDSIELSSVTSGANQIFALLDLETDILSGNTIDLKIDTTELSLVIGGAAVDTAYGKISADVDATGLVALDFTRA